MTDVILLINGPEMQCGMEFKILDSFERGLDEQGFIYETVGDCEASISVQKVKEASLNLSCIEPKTVHVFLRAHGLRLLKEIPKNHLEDTLNFKLSSINENISMFIDGLSLMDPWLSASEREHLEKIHNTKLRAYYKRGIERYTYLENKLETELWVGLDTKGTKFKTVVDAVQKQFPNKKMTFFLNSCYGAVIHDHLCKSYPNINFISFGSPNMPVWLADCNNFYLSFPETKKHYNGTFTIKKVLQDFLATDYASEPVFHVQHSPIVTVNQTKINIENLIPLNRKLTKKDETTIHNELQYLLEKQVIQTMINKLKNNEIDDIKTLKQVTEPKIFGIYMAMGVSLSDSL